MNNKHKRLLLFLIGCMGARFGLVYLIKIHNSKYKNILASLLVIPAIGFFYIYHNGLRLTGGEVFGDKIWWNSLRPFHGIMYILAAGLVYYKNKKAYIAILIDTIVGLGAFTHYHLS